MLRFPLYELYKVFEDCRQGTLYEAGLGDEEIRRLESYFREIPAHQIER